MKNKTKDILCNFLFYILTLIIFMSFLMVMSSDAIAGTAFLKYERISGMNKICTYDYLGSDVAITVKSYELCPLTIQV